MWLFDKRNFTSTVAYNPSKDKVKDSDHKRVAEASADPEGMWLLVRSRLGEDLDNLESQLQVILKDDKYSIYVQEDVSADYSWRALVSRDAFKAYLCAQVDDLDYGAHFKEVVKANTTVKSTQRYSAMMSIWTAMAALQNSAPYGGWTTSYGSSGSSTSAATLFTPEVSWTRLDDVIIYLQETGTEGLRDLLNEMDDRAFEAAFLALNLFEGEGPLSDQDMEDIGLSALRQQFADEDAQAIEVLTGGDAHKDSPTV